MLVLGSPDYIGAVQKDLEAAAEALDDPTRLIVVSSRLFRSARLDEHTITSDAGVQRSLGGGRVSLNARVARTLLRMACETGWHVSKLRVAYEAAIARVSEVHVNERQRMTDDEVRRFIIENLSKQSRPTATSLLRELRNSGRACEQKRFKDLFVEVRQRRHGA
jgi:hypothetical protein